MKTKQLPKNTWKWVAVVLFTVLVVQNVANRPTTNQTEEIVPIGTEFNTYLQDNYSGVSKDCTVLYQDPIKEGANGTKEQQKKIDSTAVKTGSIDKIFSKLGIEQNSLDIWRDELAIQIPDGYITEYCLIDNSNIKQRTGTQVTSIYFLVEGVKDGYAYIVENKAVDAKDTAINFEKSMLIPSSDITHIYPNTINGNTLYSTQNSCYGDQCLTQDGLKWNYYEITQWDYNSLENCITKVTDSDNLKRVCGNEYKPQ